MEVITSFLGLYRRDPRTIRAPSRLPVRISSRIYLFLIFLTCLICGLFLLFSASIYQHTIYELFLSLLAFGIIFLLISGILGTILIINGVLYLLQRKHRDRLRRRSRRWRRPPYTPMEHESHPPSSRSEDLIPTKDNIDDIDLSYTNIPDWLIPLLKNRSTAMAIHEDLIASSRTPEEAESRFQSRIDDLETEVITIYQHRQAAVQNAEPSDVPPVGLLTETEIEKEAVLDLLGALELQYKDGKVTKAFYERKRDQLLERLAKAVRDTE